MKRSMYGFIVSGLLCLGFQNTLSASFYNDPSDYKVVNAIKRVSNLTQADADRITLRLLGKLQNYVAGTAGMFAAFQGGMQAYKFGDWAETGLVGTPEKPAESGLLKTYLSANLFNVISDKRFWAVAGVIGAAGVSYRVLEPRLARGIIDRVKTFVEMCENLDVYNFNYAQYQGGLPSMGSATANSQQKPYDSQWLSVNAAWVASNIAREKGIANLISQADIAMELLTRVENTDEVKNLRTRIGTIKMYLTNNQPTIQSAAQQEKNQRSQNLAYEQQAAQLDLTKDTKKTGWWARVYLATTTLGNLVQGTLKTLAYISDNKEKIISGAATTALALYGTYHWAKSQLPGAETLQAPGK